MATTGAAVRWRCCYLHPSGLGEIKWALIDTEAVVVGSAMQIRPRFDGSVVNSETKGIGICSQGVGQDYRTAANAGGLVAAPCHLYTLGVGHGSLFGTSGFGRFVGCISCPLAPCSLGQQGLATNTTERQLATGKRGGYQGLGGL